jgi:hypothetical protein
MSPKNAKRLAELVCKKELTYKEKIEYLKLKSIWS